jgi:hypothetical protein
MEMKLGFHQERYKFLFDRNQHLAVSSDRTVDVTQATIRPNWAVTFIAQKGRGPREPI